MAIRLTRPCEDMQLMLMLLRKLRNLTLPRSVVRHSLWSPGTSPLAGHPYSARGEVVVLRERVGGGEDAEVRCRLPLGVGADHVQAAAGAADRDVEQVGRGADPVAGAAARGLVGAEDEDHDVGFLALHLVNGADVLVEELVHALGSVLKRCAQRVARDRAALAGPPRGTG